MNLRTITVAIVSLGIGAALGVLAYVWLVGGSGTPSAEISAPTLDINALPTLNPTQAFAALTQVAELQQTNDALSTALDDANATAVVALGQAQTAVQEASNQPLPTEVTATSTPVEVAETTEAIATEEAASTEEAAVGAETTRALYRIDSTASTVTFALQEDLRGVRTDVIGTTSEVAGDVIIDSSNPSASQIGTIRINARTLATDNEFRNRALRSEILQSANDSYEFIEFVPTTLTGLPVSITPATGYEFQITGDLTIVGQTQPVTFDANVTLNGDQLTGTATAVIKYADWGISIPNVPSVANVTEDVTLTITFVANQVVQ